MGADDFGAQGIANTIEWFNSVEADVGDTGACAASAGSLVLPLTAVAREAD